MHLGRINLVGVLGRNFLTEDLQGIQKTKLEWYLKENNEKEKLNLCVRLVSFNRFIVKTNSGVAGVLWKEPVQVSADKTTIVRERH